MNNPFGKVEAPEAIKNYGLDVPGGGLIQLLNIGLNTLVVLGGIYFLFNLIFAGYQYMNAGGDKEAVQRAWARIWQSLLGVVIIAGSFLIAAVIGQLVFGNPGAILNPKIFKPV